MTASKKHDQVFTPPDVVSTILDEVGYTRNIANKRILEPSCGDGAFLVQVVERLIEDCLREGYSLAATRKQLEKNIIGIEIDADLCERARSNLSAVSEKHGIYNVRWKIFNKNALFFSTTDKYDFVVGNPPYIRVHNLNQQERDIIKNLSFTSGTTDLYIAFMELGIRALSESGRLGFITPNSYLKNKSQRNLRQFLADNNLIEKIIDYKTTRVFPDADTYVAITILDKLRKGDSFSYVSVGDDAYTVSIGAEEALRPSSPWVFAKDSDREFLSAVAKRHHSIGDCACVQNGIATNKDGVYVITPSSEHDEFIITNDGHVIEKGVLRPVIKASRVDGDRGRYILFPYQRAESGNWLPINEALLSAIYPQAYKYLLANKEKLSKRDMDGRGEWFRYARSQGLKNVDKDKLVFSHIISPDQQTMSVKDVSSETLVYSGVYITAVTSSLFALIKEQLSSADFLRYCRLCGKDMSGGYKTINTQVIKNYKFDI